jgi:exopolysaccharide production protein ExoZ
MEADSKIPSIQLLRGLAALTVAVVHLWFGFASYVDSRDAAPLWSSVLAQSAVAAFFVISGTVMVISSRRLFGSLQGTLTFWRRRAVRVLPPYWIATLMFAGVALWLGLPFDSEFAARSLLFLPGEGAAQVPLMPFLWPGWTLFFELVFYAIFGAFVLAGREKAIGYTAAVLVLIVATAAIWEPGTHLAAAFAHPVVLLFVAGMAAGLFLDAGRSLPGGLRLLAGFGAVAAIVVGPDMQPNTLGWEWLARAGVAGMLAFVAVAGGPITVGLARVSEHFWRPELRALPASHSFRARLDAGFQRLVAAPRRFDRLHDERSAAVDLRLVAVPPLYRAPHGGVNEPPSG